jgi:hypothetical protein
MRRSLIVLAVVTAGVAARADPPRTSSLTWTRATGAEDCIGALDLARAVEERLGRPVFVSASSAQLTIDGRIERRASSQGWRAVVTLRSAKGEDLGVLDYDSELSAERIAEFADRAASRGGRSEAMALAQPQLPSAWQRKPKSHVWLLHLHLPAPPPVIVHVPADPALQSASCPQRQAHV